MAYLGENIKKLGFGLMRLPQKDEKIDVEQVKKKLLTSQLVVDELATWNKSIY